VQVKHRSHKLCQFFCHFCKCAVRILLPVNTFWHQIYGINKLLNKSWKFEVFTCNILEAIGLEVRNHRKFLPESLNTWNWPYQHFFQSISETTWDMKLKFCRLSRVVWAIFPVNFIKFWSGGAGKLWNFCWVDMEWPTCNLSYTEWLLELLIHLKSEFQLL